MKFISWNVNGLRACMNKGFKEFMDSVDADVFAFRKQKCSVSRRSLFFLDMRSTGTALKKGVFRYGCFSKVKPLTVTYGLGIEEHDKEGRVITAEYKEFYLVNVYTPNSQRGLERLDYRQIWEDAFRDYLLKLDQIKPVLVCGDLNVAHREIDLKNWKTNRNNAGFTDEERAKMTELLTAGFTDSFRHLYPEKKVLIPGGRICLKRAKRMRDGVLITGLFLTDGLTE